MGASGVPALLVRALCVVRALLITEVRCLQLKGKAGTLPANFSVLDSINGQPNALPQYYNTLCSCSTFLYVTDIVTVTSCWREHTCERSG